MGPLSWSAIAAGSAALTESLGLGAAATGLIAGNKNKNIEEFKNWAKTQYPMPEIKVNVPSAENALVLRPEYRTVTTPVEYIGYKPLFSNIVISDEDIKENAKESSSTPSPTPSKDPKDDDKKPKGDVEDKSSTNKSQSAIKRGWNKQGLPKKVENSTLKQDWHSVGQNIAYGIGRFARFVSSPGFAIPIGITGGAALGGYWALRDNNADKANQIDTIATRKNNTSRFNVVEIAE